MVDHLEAGRNELYLSTDKLLTDFYHGASASFTDLFAFIDRVEHFAAGNVFYQFFPLAGIFSFAQMFFCRHQIRLLRLRIGAGFSYYFSRMLLWNICFYKTAVRRLYAVQVKVCIF